ncbi:hypothetical protein Hypma_006520 [Hypsizygus marmoreus]|uniref:Uncharacterized protein n=1 Tax=Hypsizygus marmoreus TaxID=39966 RepID=A0A369JUU0_HYPMA|nr:hypothetical protein Hypma_006520 [Hypsizygus marmoreus]
MPEITFQDGYTVYSDIDIKRVYLPTQRYEAGMRNLAVFAESNPQDSECLELNASLKVCKCPIKSKRPNKFTREIQRIRTSLTDDPSCGSTELLDVFIATIRNAIQDIKEKDDIHKVEANILKAQRAAQIFPWPTKVDDPPYGADETRLHGCLPPQCPSYSVYMVPSRLVTTSST